MQTGLLPVVELDPPDAGGKIDFIEIIKGAPEMNSLIGTRVAVRGDVYPVLGLNEVPLNQGGVAALAPVVTQNGGFPMIDRKRAVALIEARRARKHSGPARLADAPKVENAALKQPGQSERAVARPQRRGAM